MKEIKIVEYNDDLANGVAQMWNESRESWGGGDSVRTAEQVRQNQANADNLHTYIALVDNEVVGYCSLTEYREDKGALYIPLLNVRNDFHGKKIGKALVKNAVQRTIELGWPRLDLYTWPGNTKAVPLYKKCGFFWEEKEQATHLMNFIPTVLNTEAVKDFFDEFDWYQDSKRIIEVKPDGNKVGDFKYLEYSWEKNNHSLRMEFEQTGRGLSLIETDDYLISVHLDNSKLVFGTKYPISYKVINKTGNPLHIEFEGTDNENVQFKFKEEIDVLKDKEIHASFFVEPIEEEIIDFRTFPTVTTNININGKKAVFKHGFMPKYPLNVKPALDQEEFFIGKESLLYLDLDNQFMEKVDFEIEIPKTSFIDISDQVNISLEAKERKTIELKYKLHDFGFYQEEIKVKAKRKNGEIITFSKKLNMIFKGLGAKLGGETDLDWQITNGLFYVALSKFDNFLSFGYGRKSLRASIHYPKLGKPYTSELSKQKPTKVVYIQDNTTITMKAIYEIKGIEIINNVKLYANGMVEQFYELLNKTTTSLKDIWLYRPQFISLNRITLPYCDKYLDIPDDSGFDYDYWDSEKITENWLFSKDDKFPIGLSWNPEEKVNFGGWFVYFETCYKELNPHDKVTTNPIYISLGAYRDWKSFKAFALNEKEETNDILFTSDHIEFNINDGNPVVNRKINVKVLDYKKSYLEGNIEIHNNNECLQKETFTSSDEKNQVEFNFNHDFKNKIETLYLNADLKSMNVNKKSVIINASTEDVIKEVYQAEGKEVYSFNNHSITIKASPQFYPALFSMVKNNEEWLDSSFPNVKPKVWWNPWSGGMTYFLGNLTNRSISKEKVTVDFATLYDQYENKWQGLKISSNINEHEKYKGLVINQYYLMLPNVPFICHLMEIIQNTNQTMFQVPIYLNSYFKTSKENDNGYLRFNNNTYPLHQSGREIEGTSNFLFGSKERDNSLQIYSYQDVYKSEIYAHKELTEVVLYRNIDLTSGNTMFMPPVYYIINKETFDEEAFGQLHRLRFHQK